MVGTWLADWALVAQAEPGGWWLVWASQELALGFLLQNTYTTALAAGTESSCAI